MIYMFLAQGFEETEALAPLDILRRAGLEVKTVGIGGDLITGAHGITVKADMPDVLFRDSKPDMVILPGGMPGASNLRACKKVCDLVCLCAGKRIPIGAICAAPFILGELGLLTGKKAICYPGFEDKLIGAEISDKNCVRDGNIITAAGMGAALPFSCELVSILYGKEKAEEILRAIIA